MLTLIAVVAAACAFSPPPGVATLEEQRAAGLAVMSGPFHVESSFPVGGEGGWDYLIVDSESGRLFVPRGTHVMVLDTKDGKVLGDIPDTAGVHGVALGSGKGFTSNGRAGTVTVFDLASLKVQQTVKAGENPDAILFEPATKRVFAFNGRSKDATVIDAADGTVLGTIPLGGKPEFAVHDGAGTVYVNVEDTSELVAIDPKEMKVKKRIALAPGEEPSGLAIDPANKRLFSVCSNQKMIVVDPEAGKVLATPAIGKGVDGAAFDAVGGFAIASNGDGTLTVVSTKNDTFEPVQTLLTAQRARTIAIDPKSRRMYLPTAEFEAPKETPGEGRPARPAMKPGTFRILVVAPSGPDDQP